MPLLSTDQLRFRFSDSDADVLQGIDWSADVDQVHLVVGDSGSGKSTFLRTLNGLIPHFHGGRFGGNVVVAGLNTRSYGPRELAGITGTVFQDPEAQLVTDTVEDEVVFGMEQLGFPLDRMRTSLERVLELLEIQQLRYRHLSTLSGGERQKVALASAIVVQPQVLLLDEPTSQLDPAAAQEFLNAVGKVMRQTPLVAVIAEHRLERMLPASTHIIEMLPGDFRAGRRDDLLPTLSEVPPLIEFGRCVGLSPPPMTPEQTRAELIRHQFEVYPARKDSTTFPTPGASMLSVERIAFKYQNQPVIEDVTFQASRGESIALIGRNGSGKSTLIKLLIGLIRPQHGRILIEQRPTSGMAVQDIARTVGYVPQHASAILHQETPQDELQFTLNSRGISGDIQQTLAELGIEHLVHRHQLDLSGGERQRVAIAALAIARPDVLLLDEPTRGLPAADKWALGEFIVRYVGEGKIVIVATHDMDFVANYTNRVLKLANHRLESDGDTVEILSGSDMFTTQLQLALKGNIIKLNDIDFQQAFPNAPRFPVLTQNQAD